MEFIDKFGEIRRNGSLLKPANFVSAYRTFEGEFPVWSDSEIRAALTHPQRRVARKVFGDEWIPNQGPYGSCNGWAAANAFSRARYLGGKTDGAQYSGSWIYGLINGGRDAGSALEDGLRVSMEVGFVTREQCPYDKIYPSRQSPGLREIAATNKAVDCYAVQTMQGFRTAGAAGFMLIAAVMAGQGFESQDENGVSAVDYGQGNHAVTLDDHLLLPTGQEVFDAVMDWGLAHGTRGKTYLTAKSFAQTFNAHQFYAVPTGQHGGTR